MPPSGGQPEPTRSAGGDSVPDQAKQRQANVAGIMKMRERLACLTQEYLKTQAEKQMPGAFS